MVKGYQTHGIAPSSADVSRLSHIIDAVLCPSDETKRESISPYVYQLFLHFLQKQEDVLINWNDWTHHKIQYVDYIKVRAIYGHRNCQSNGI